MVPSPYLVIVVTGGDAPDPALVDRLDLVSEERRSVVAADSGIAHALALGLVIDVAVGDFDSVDPDLLASVEAGPARIERHPVAKDATDLELALDAAVGLGATRVVVLGGHGGRLDHFLANATVIAAPKYEAIGVEALIGTALVTIVRPGPGVHLQGRPGELVTLLPVHGPASGVRTEGLRYPLDDETLTAGTTRGVSNELASEEGRVTIRGGVLLVIRPVPEAARPQPTDQPRGPR